MVTAYLRTAGVATAGARQRDDTGFPGAARQRAAFVSARDRVGRRLGTACPRQTPPLSFSSPQSVASRVQKPAYTILFVAY